MDLARCPRCHTRMKPVIASGSGRTDLKRLQCDRRDPLQTDAAKWAESALARGGLKISPLD
jgi:hypothetical protein